MNFLRIIGNIHIENTEYLDDKYFYLFYYYLKYLEIYFLDWIGYFEFTKIKYIII